MRTPSRNRLAKPLPDRWREWLVDQGVPKRKYTAVLNAALADGSTVADVVVEEGWIVSVGTAALAADVFEQRIEFDPEAIVALEVLEVV